MAIKDTRSPWYKVDFYIVKLQLVSLKANIDSNIDITIGDYTRPEPILIKSTPERSPSPPPRMNLRSATYHIAKEVANSFDYEDGDALEDENDVTTDSGDESDERFDSSDDNEFNDETMGDYDAADDFIDID